MKDKVIASFMWVASIPITAKGVDMLARGVVTVFGALTAMFGFLMAFCGLIWWVRRLRRQRIKLEVEEMQLKVWQEGERRRKHRPAGKKFGTEDTEEDTPT